MSKELLQRGDARHIEPIVPQGGLCGVHLFAGHWLVEIVIVMWLAKTCIYDVVINVGY